jgi:hypothetical protein
MTPKGFKKARKLILLTRRKKYINRNKGLKQTRPKVKFRRTLVNGL